MLPSHAPSVGLPRRQSEKKKTIKLLQMSVNLVRSVVLSVSSSSTTAYIDRLNDQSLLLNVAYTHLSSYETPSASGKTNAPKFSHRLSLVNLVSM